MMFVFLGALRLVLRLGIMAVLCLTAVNVWQSDPGNWSSPTDHGFMAPPRAPAMGFVQQAGEHISGGPVSLSLFGFQFIDPALAIMSVLSVPSTLATVLWAVLIPLVLCVCFGRVFCGYICPIGWLATWQFHLQRRLKTTYPSTRPVSQESAGILFLLLIVLIAVAGLPSAAALGLVHLQTQRVAAHVTDPSIVWTASGIIFAFVVANWVFAPGIWCRYLCPSGTVYRIVARYRLFGIVHSSTKKCPGHCTLCADVCWLHLDPKSAPPGPACDLCLDCVKACPHRKLGLRPALGSQRRFLQKSLLGIIIPFLIAFSYAPAVLSENPPRVPLLDGNPPWSTRINHLDWEGWSTQGSHAIGLSVSFVEETDQGSLYIFSASRIAVGEVILEPQSVVFTISSNGRSASLFQEKPNSPRSTIEKTVYSGRAFVARDACSTLKIKFTDTGQTMQVAFPEQCRKDPWFNFGLGFGLWSALAIALVGLIVVISRKRNES
jgi:hypothetical protein